MSKIDPASRLGFVLDGQYILNGILGVGASGVVYTALEVSTNKAFAVKALSKIGLDARQSKFRMRELALHAKIQHHPNIVSLEAILDAPECIYVVMEFCPLGDLFTAITETKEYIGEDSLIKQVFLQLLDAVEFCHKNNVYHQDLKPENILVSNNFQTLKIADFGLATSDMYSSDFGCGSTFYMSPECQKPIASGFPYYDSAANDVWSLGVILVNLTCGRNPWKRASTTDETFKAYLSHPKLLGKILPLTPEFETILKCVFEVNPAKRIKLQHLRQAVSNCSRFTVKARPKISSIIKISSLESSNTGYINPGQTSIATPPLSSKFGNFENSSKLASLRLPPTPTTPRYFQDYSSGEEGATQSVEFKQAVPVRKSMRLAAKHSSRQLHKDTTVPTLRRPKKFCKTKKCKQIDESTDSCNSSDTIKNSSQLHGVQCF